MLARERSGLVPVATPISVPILGCRPLRSTPLLDDLDPAATLPGGDASTAGQVASLYGELLAMAHRLRRTERDDHTLETSAIVHEAFLRLATQHAADWQSRACFLGAAANTMRRVLVDDARTRNAGKRDAGVRTTPVACLEGANDGTDVLDLLALDDVLERLAVLDPRQARMVELRVFGGFEGSRSAGLPALLMNQWCEPGKSDVAVDLLHENTSICP